MIIDWANAVQSPAVVVHADFNYNLPRCAPRFLARGPFNAWGYDSGINGIMTHNLDGKWELQITDNWPAYVQLNMFDFDDYFHGDIDGNGVFDRYWKFGDTVRRYPDIDIYHVNNYHGALVPLYLLPKVLPVCLSLHNTGFQGLWPLRAKEEMKEVCSAFNISKEHCTKYVQFGNTFNLLHAVTSFISIHQKSIGVAGVSDKYGKQSQARYPALWTLKHVDSLPNPDPSDIDALDENPVTAKDVVNKDAEAKRPEPKRQAQGWAGIAQDPDSDLFVFVGCWLKQWFPVDRNVGCSAVDRKQNSSLNKAIVPCLALCS